MDSTARRLNICATISSIPATPSIRWSAPTAKPIPPSCGRTNTAALSGARSHATARSFSPATSASPREQRADYHRHRAQRGGKAGNLLDVAGHHQGPSHRSAVSRKPDSRGPLGPDRRRSCCRCGRQPNFTGASTRTNFASNPPSTVTRSNIDTRIDHNFTDTTKFSGASAISRSQRRGIHLPRAGPGGGR